jgi:putative ABC transport system substrate-binding protein
LAELGWEEGRNLHIEYRWYEGDAQLADRYAVELIGLGMDVILAFGTPPTAALKKHTQTVPIIFSVVADPVGAGFVQSLAQPGANITGFTTFEPGMAGKWLELLKEIAPQTDRVAPVFNPQTAPLILMPSVNAVAPKFGLELAPAAAYNEEQLENAISSFAQQPHGSLLIFPDSFAIVHRKLILELADRFRLPAIYPFPFFVKDGGLMSYGVSITRLVVRSADYVDQVLRGAQPANLPVQQPNEFQLLVNVKVANSLGLTVPSTLLARADEVIE